MGSAWRDRFQTFDPEAFPDLTGLSSVGKKISQKAGQKAERTLEFRLSQFQSHCDQDTFAAEIVFQAVWAKLLFAYSGETNAYFTYSSSIHDDIPVNICIAPTCNNVEALGEVQKYWDDFRSASPADILHIRKLTEKVDNGAKAIRVFYHRTGVGNTAVTPGECRGISADIFHDGDLVTLKLRYDGALLSPDDTSYLFEAFRTALSSQVEDRAAPFLAWSSSTLSFTRSVSNIECQSTRSSDVETVVTLFQAHVRKQPQTTALDFLHHDGTRTMWTYEKLDSLAEAVADTLILQLGILPGDPVAVSISKSPAFYVSILAVMKSGATFTPFTNVPNERKSFMFEELGAKLVLHNGTEDITWCPSLAAFDISGLLDESERLSSPYQSLVQKPQVAGSSLVYQMYTSGSTGRPKAVSLEHQNAVETVLASKSLVPWRLESRMLQYAAPSFDMCYYDTFLAWSLGITLCSASEKAVYNNLTGVINTLRTDLLGLTPSVALTLNPEEVMSVRWIYCIGEALPQILVDRWQGRLVNSYGPTEAAQMVTLFPVDTNIKSSIIGKPFSNTSFVVLQRETQTIAPILSAGELCIGGFQIARGYHANEEKTQKAFVVVEGKRMYRTGDLVRMLGNGNFQFLGRVDDQVKIRGQRVELGEINQALIDSHPDISGSSTQILKVQEKGKEQLVAFIVLSRSLSSNEKGIVQEEALSHLKCTLPPYMVPKIILIIDEIPLSPSRKVDKRRLLSYLQDRNLHDPERYTDDLLEDKWTDLEIRVRDAYATVSGCSVDSVTRNITIFELGIDSISAIRVASLLREQSMIVDASDVLEMPSISLLRQHLSTKSAAKSYEPLERTHFDFDGFNKSNIHHILETNNFANGHLEAIRPCTPLQAGMIAQTINSEKPLYFNHLIYELNTDCDRELLQRSWTATVDKYEVLRTGFAHTGNSHYPLAMVTYDTTSFHPPIFSDTDFELDSQTIIGEMWQSMVNATVTPPWKLIITRDRYHLIIHHSIYDAQVLNLWLRDVSLFYGGLKVDSPISIESELSKFLVHDNSHQQATEAYWTSMKGQLIGTKFPILTPLRCLDTRFKSLSKTYGPGIHEVEAHCKRLGISLQAAGQVAWGRILSAYTGDELVTFGTVLSGRTTEISNEAGLPCITTVPTPFNAGLDLKDQFAQMLKFNAQVWKHQFLSLNRIQKLTSQINDALFDTIFTLQNPPRTHSHEAPFRFKSNELTIDYPVSLELEPSGNGTLRINLYFQIDRLPEQQASLLIEQYEDTLGQILEQQTNGQDTTVGAKDGTLYSLTPAIMPVMKCQASTLHGLFEQAVAEFSDKIALEHVLNIPDGDEDVARRRWSFKEVNDEGNRFANLFQFHGAKVGSIIAICFDKCPEAGFAMLGILKAGCSFLALDPGAPQDRKAFILKDSGAIILATKGTEMNWAKGDAELTVINLDKTSLGDFSCNAPSLDRPVAPEDLAYCLYTSGTTGQPKGCAITHENVTQAMMSFQSLYKRDEASRWLQFASYHFDVSVMEHFWSWSVGMCVVTASRDLIFADLAGAIRKLGITHIDLTPSLARILDPHDLPTLAGGVFVVGGEMLRQDILDKWGPTGAIHNAYGPTEATIGVTMYPGVPINGRPANIGRQFPNVGSFVVDPKNPNRAVYRGAVGELCVSGKLVAKGYIGRPELTAERFITLEGQRTYRTGDLVRILYDGTFDFIGRVDDQVKLRGQRLEIGEINSVIRAGDDDILDVATQVLKHPKQKKEQLVSFIVSREFSRISTGSAKIVLEQSASQVADKLKSICEAKLPPYMVPTHFVMINRLPLSANNKADAKQLKLLYSDLDLALLQNSHGNKAKTGGFSPDFLEKERKILNALAATTGVAVADLRPDTSFFELGLDSISIISLSRALKLEGIRLSTAVIMRNPSVHRLAKIAAELNANPTPSDSSSVWLTKQRIKAFQHRHELFIAKSLGVPWQNVETFAPCTPLQQGILSKALKDSNGLYFNRFVFSGISTALMERLKRAIQALVDNIQVLRTKFLPTDDGYAQVVLKEVPAPIKSFTVPKPSPHAELEAIIRRRHDLWIRTATETQIVDPFAVTIVDRGDELTMSLSIFHASYDGRSLDLLLDCLRAELRNDFTITYGPKFHDLLPYGPLQEKPKAREFWIHYLKDIAVSDILHVQARHPELPKTFHRLTHRIVDLKTMEPTRRSLNTTHQSILQTCWSAVLQEFADAVVLSGIVLSGSSVDFDDAGSVIGPTFNTLPFFIEFKEDGTWAESIRDCQYLNSEIIAYQHTPLRDIQKWMRQGEESGQTELFRNIFTFQRHVIQKDVQEAPWKHVSEHVTSDFPLAFELVQKDDSTIQVSIAVQSSLATAEECKALVDKFETCLKAVCADASTKISNIIRIPSKVFKKARSGTKPSIDSGYDSSTQEEIERLREVSNADNCKWSTIALKIRKEIAELSGAIPEDILLDTSFLELGLDSVDAVKLSSRLKSRLGVYIPVSKLMIALTTRNIAILQSNSSHSYEAQQSLTEFEALQQKLVKHLSARGFNTSGEVLPCTPLQEGMISDMLNTEYRQYLNHDVLEIDPQTDISVLKNSWTSVIDAIPLLRSAVVQITDTDVDCAFALVEQLDFNPWHPDNIISDAKFENLLEDIRNDMHSCKREPPFRLSFVRHTETNKPKYLILTISHALYDGWSINLLHEMVLRAYKQGGVAPRLEQSATKPYLARILSVSSTDSTSFWRHSLQGATPSCIRRQELQEDQRLGIIRLTRISPLTANKVQDFCRRNHVTAAAFTQTVWSCVLATILKQLDVAFGLVLSGRDTEEAQCLIFPTMNTVISRCLLHGSLLEMVKYVQHNLAVMTEHQHFPLRKSTALARNSQAKQPFNTLFMFQKRPSNEKSKDRHLYHSIDSASGVEYPLCVEAELEGNDLVWRFACNSGYLNTQSCQKLLNDLDLVAGQIIDHPHSETVQLSGHKAQISRLDSFEPSLEAIDEANGELFDFDGNEDESWSRLEAIIRDVVARVAGLESNQISKRYSLLTVGLDSISAIKVSALLREHGILLTVGEMLRARDLSEMTKIFERKSDGSQSKLAYNDNYHQDPVTSDPHFSKALNDNGVDASRVDSISPATAGQVFMLSKWQNHNLYWSQISFKIDGVGNKEAIELAWRDAERQLPILRATFIATGKKDFPVLQVILNESQLAVHSMTKASEVEVNIPSKGLIRPVQVSIDSCGDSLWEIKLDLSHAIFDGYSLHLLLERLRCLLSGDVAEAYSSLQGFSEYHSRRIADGSDTKHFWKRYLANLTAKRLLPMIDRESRRSHVIRPHLNSKSAMLKSLSRAEKTTLQAVLIAAWSVIYAHLCRSETSQVAEVVVGIFTASRNFDGADILDMPTLGFVPLRIKTPLQTNLMELARQVQSDLDNISQGSRSTVGLSQLKDWTGEDLIIDTWVNIILGDGVGGSRLQEKPEGPKIVFEESRQAKDSIYDIEPNVGTLAGRGLFLEENAVRKLYAASVDFEATVYKDCVDVGILAPHTLLSHSDVHSALDQFQVCLDELASKGMNAGPELHQKLSN